MKNMNFKLLALTAAVMLTACGGGGNNDTTSNESGSVVLSGQVVDAPIEGAQVCLFIDGVQARSAGGPAICSGQTDAQGSYTMTIPRNLAPGFVTLVASKGSNIKLASTLGSFAQVLEAAGNSGTITPASLPTARVTHFTTADFALADADKNGTVSKDELGSYVPDFAAVRKVAAVIKAVIDFEGQAGGLIGGQTTNTLNLAWAVARDQLLGTSNKRADEWLADPANANILAALNQDVAQELEGRFSDYQVSEAVTSHFIPPMVTRDGAGIYCSVPTGNDSSLVEIAFDSARRIAVIKFAADGEDPAGQIVGSYDPQTGAVNLTEAIPRKVTMANASGITYYEEYNYTMIGTVNATTGAMTGTFSEMSATTWSLDATRQECTAQGSVTATRL